MGAVLGLVWKWNTVATGEAALMAMYGYIYNHISCMTGGVHGL